MLTRVKSCIAAFTVSLFASAQASMWLMPEFDASCPVESQLLKSGMEQPLNDAIVITPSIVYDNEVRSVNLELSCGSLFREYTVSDLRTSCKGGWQFEVVRHGQSLNGGLTPGESYVLCGHYDLLTVIVPMLVSQEEVVFKASYNDNASTLVDADAQ